MVIQDLKPSQRVEGRWLAVLEDGSILRLGEGEVVDFALYAGKELSEGEAEALTAGGTPERTAPESPQPADRQTHVPPGAGAEAAEAGRRGRRRQPPSLTGWRSWASSTTPPTPPRWCRYYSAKGYGERKLRDELLPPGDSPGAVGRGPGGGRGPLRPPSRRFCGKSWRGTLPDDPRELKKASDALARRGYSWSDIVEGLRRYGAEAESDE